MKSQLTIYSRIMTLADVEGISHQMESMSINKALIRLRKIIKK